MIVQILQIYRLDRIIQNLIDYPIQHVFIAESLHIHTITGV